MFKKTNKRIKKRRITKRRRQAWNNGGEKSPKKFKCCICNTITPEGIALETTRCKLKGPYYRHKICPDCWWGKDDKPG